VRGNSQENKKICKKKQDKLKIKLKNIIKMQACIALENMA